MGVLCEKRVIEEHSDTSFNEGLDSVPNWFNYTFHTSSDVCNAAPKLSKFTQCN